jgi:hypothetical protein
MNKIYIAINNKQNRLNNLDPKNLMAFSNFAFRANAYSEHTHLICRLPLDYLILLARAF